ncbi:MAG TPA: flagellar motor protein MotD [Cellvibrio sp.]|nr:flagellar motor protein MotD [Cellvibrio sp.]
MIRRKKQEIHVNQERWLVSYADFITLLFAFFVVMYSISQVSESKYRVLSDTFLHAFNQPVDSVSSTSPEQASNPSSQLIVPIEPEQQPASIVETKPAIVIVESDVKTAQPATEAPVTETPGQVNATEPTPEVNDELKKISDQVTNKFTQLINDNLIKVTSNEFWLQIELNDSILFSSGSAEPSAQAQVIFTEVAEILKNYTNSVQIEGFTDNIPISNSRYPTNWELSSARATAIVRWLAGKGVEPERLAAVGYGEFQPVASNETAAGRSQNRRVAVMIAKRKMERPRALIEQLK